MYAYIIVMIAWYTGEYESIFSNYQNLRMFKGNDKVTAMPRNVHQLLNVNLIIHVQAEDEIIDKIYKIDILYYILNLHLLLFILIAFI